MRTSHMKETFRTVCPVVGALLCRFEIPVGNDAHVLAYTLATGQNVARRL
jgi:hypothetical protein